MTLLFVYAANSRYDLAIKNALSAAGGTGFTFPPCSAPAYVSGTDYTGGSQVSYNGYVHIISVFFEQYVTFVFVDRYIWEVSSLLLSLLTRMPNANAKPP